MPEELIARIEHLKAIKPAGFGPNETPNYKCEKCKDEQGYFVKKPVLMSSQGEAKEFLMDHWKECDCINDRQIEKAFRSSQISFEFRKKNFDNFDLGVLGPVRDAYHCTRSYTEQFHRVSVSRHNSIALLGPPGCGKTHLLMASANSLISQGVKVQYFPWVEGFNEIKDDLSVLKERILTLQQAEVLMIDDMFKGRREPTEFQLEQAFAIINYRYMEKLPVMISSERDIRTMCNYDDALGSRIYDMCKDYLVIIQGDRFKLNYRMRED
ncbi:ATP-binding protein [Paenibacillus sp. RC84]|uniref:ATP-binding protein n=1 Tax=Paenibacillus sp. RC84 TaxID=3156252 RepID=UPI003514CCC4